MATRGKFNAAKLTSLINNAAIEVLTQGAKDIIAAAQDVLLRGHHLAEGDLRDNFGYTVSPHGSEGVSVRVFNKSDHAVVVEFGRRPGRRQPPSRDIKRWLDAKGLPSDPQTVYLVARKIAKHGIPAVRFMSRGFAQVSPTLKDKLEAKVLEAIARL